VVVHDDDDDDDDDDLIVDGERVRTGRCLRRRLDVKAAQRQSPTASTPAGQVDQRRSRLVGMGDPAMYLPCSTSDTSCTSRRSALTCSHVVIRIQGAAKRSNPLITLPFYAQPVEFLTSILQIHHVYAPRSD